MGEERKEVGAGRGWERGGYGGEEGCGRGEGREVGEGRREGGDGRGERGGRWEKGEGEKTKEEREEWDCEKGMWVTYWYVFDVFDAVMECRGHFFIAGRTQEFYSFLALSEGAKVTKRSHKPQSRTLFQ